MKLGWSLVLVFSVALNGGLLYNQLRRDSDRQPSRPSPTSPWVRSDDREAERFIDRRVRKLSRRCGLAADQQERLRKIIGESLPQISQQRGTLYEARRRLVEVFAEPGLDPAALRAARARVNAVRADLDSVVFESLIREASVLTPEQRRDHAELLLDRHSRSHHERRSPEGTGRDRGRGGSKK